MTIKPSLDKYDIKEYGIKEPDCYHKGDWAYIGPLPQRIQVGDQDLDMGLCRCCFGVASYLMLRAAIFGVNCLQIKLNRK